MRLNRDENVLKRPLRRMFAWSGRFPRAADRWLRIRGAIMQHMYDGLLERMADNETKLLNAFYTFAESNQKRLAEIRG